MKARYYDGGRGQFLSLDPAYVNLSMLNVQLADPQSWNSYAYARNNPLVMVDKNGEFAFIALLAIPAGFGVANMGALLVQDMASGQPSSLKDYGAAFVGGVAGGYTAVGATAVGLTPLCPWCTSGLVEGVTDSVQEATSQVLKGEYDLGEIGAQGGQGLFFGIAMPPILRETLGKQIITKTIRRSITNILPQTAAKIGATEFVNSVAEPTIMGAAQNYPLHSSINERLQLMKQQLDDIQRKIDRIRGVDSINLNYS